MVNIHSAQSGARRAALTDKTSEKKLQRQACYQPNSFAVYAIARDGAP
jgi:hypothetical protein